MIAKVGVPEDQEPPRIVSPNVAVALTHTALAPVIVPTLGNALMVSIVVVKAVPQLLINAYEIIEKPAATPVITPLLFIVAILGELELQVPPTAALLKLAIAPVHTLADPEIILGIGNVCTFKLKVAAAIPQLLPTVYEIKDMPSEIPLTTPPVEIVAIPVASELHDPPTVMSFKVEVDPAQRVAVPEILSTNGSGLIVIVFMA